MLKIENMDIMGWEHAIRGMRNPMNSWDKSDSRYATQDELDNWNNTSSDMGLTVFDHGDYILGLNDQKLMRKLASNGTADHRKFMRMITVYLDITAPLYWWKEFDTYKVGTVANSCSTMHKIAAKEFTLDDFSCEHLTQQSLEAMEDTIDILNQYRDMYNNWNDPTFDILKRIHRVTNKNQVWWQMIQLLPTSYNQKRTVMLNYEVLRNIYTSRRHHKLDEWHTLCDWIETLPMSDLMTSGDTKVSYVCDREKCSNCSYPQCSQTTDISHAKHFMDVGEHTYIEKEE